MKIDDKIKLLKRSRSTLQKEKIRHNIIEVRDDIEREITAIDCAIQDIKDLETIKSILRIR